MSIENMEPMDSSEQVDPRLEEILTYYEPGAREDALNEWGEYTEAEKERLYSQFMKEHSREAA